MVTYSRGDYLGSNPCKGNTVGDDRSSRILAQEILFSHLSAHRTVPTAQDEGFLPELGL